MCVLILVFFVYYIIKNFNDFNSITFINPYLLFPLFFIGLFQLGCYGLITKYALEPFKIKLKFKEWFGLISITNFYNTITPFRGGLIAKAIYLKRRYSLPYLNFASTWIGIYLFILLVTSGIGLISVLLVYLQYSIFNKIVLLFFLAFFVPIFVFIFFASNFNKKTNKLFAKISDLVYSWRNIKKDYNLLAKVFVTTLLALFLSALSSILYYHVFGIEISFTQSLFLIAASNLYFVTQVTPGNLGVNEAFSIFFGLTLGITPAQSLAVSILARLLNLLIVSLFGSYYTYVLLKESPRKFLQKDR